MSTTGHNDRQADEAMDQLRAANPASAGGFDARGQAMYERITSGEETGDKGPAWRRWPVLGGAVAAVGVVAVTAVMLLSGGSGDGDSNVVTPGDPTVDPAGGGGLAASCLAFTPEELRMREYAFAGTAVDVSDTTVTFSVDEVFKGELSDTVTVEPDSTLQNEMYTEFEFEEGKRYLVSGDDDLAWGCGYTSPYDGELATQWEAAFAGTSGAMVSQAVGGDAAGSCAFFFEDATLLQRDRAFDGVITNIEENVQGPGGISYPKVTFEVTTWYKGGDSATVDLLASGLAYGDRTSDTPVLQIGERYLVSGDAEFAWGCGFTRTHSDAEADRWQALFAE